MVRDMSSCPYAILRMTSGLRNTALFQLNPEGNITISCIVAKDCLVTQGPPFTRNAAVVPVGQASGVSYETKRAGTRSLPVESIEFITMLIGAMILKLCWVFYFLVQENTRPLQGQVRRYLDLKVPFRGAILPLCTFQRPKLGFVFALSAYITLHSLKAPLISR